VPHHARLGEREGSEHPEYVEVDERVHVGAEDEDQRGGNRRQNQDAVREHEAVTEVRELPREEAVAGHDRGQSREPLVGRVRGQDQDPEREDLDDPEHEVCG